MGNLASLCNHPCSTQYCADALLRTKDLSVDLQTLELLLLIVGWIVAFLLGKELAEGFRQWREARAARRDDSPRP